MRPILVQKFGGTSVGSVPRIHHVATLALAAQREGFDVVVVVSAMSGETNRLLALADDVAEGGSRRERDALAASGEQASAALTALAIQAAGGKARSFLGHQIRVLTDGQFGDARVLKVEPDALIASLAKGEIPVVAGFQGIDGEGNITTLGRGGSDTTAVAVAAALKAQCDIYTDVDGVYTADPNIVKSARKLATVSYRHMLTFAALGAKVLHDRCVELAAEHNVPVQVRTSFGDTPGTTITTEEPGADQGRASGLAADRKLIRIYGAPDTSAEKMSSLLKCLNDNNTPTFDAESGSTAFTIRTADLGSLRQLLKGGEFPMVCLEDVARVSIVGSNLASNPRVESKASLLLKGFGIKVKRKEVRENYLSYMVAVADADETMRVLHDGMAIGVGREHGEKTKPSRKRRRL